MHNQGLIQEFRLGGTTDRGFSPPPPTSLPKTLILIGHGELLLVPLSSVGLHAHLLMHTFIFLALGNFS